MPTTGYTSLTVMGRPCSRPSVAPDETASSAAFAARRAPSSSMATMALILPLVASTWSKWRSSSSQALILLSRNACSIAVAEPKMSTGVRMSRRWHVPVLLMVATTSVRELLSAPGRIRTSDIRFRNAVETVSASHLESHLTCSASVFSSSGLVEHHAVARSRWTSGWTTSGPVGVQGVRRSRRIQP